MGKAIIIPDISFLLNNLGKVTFIGQEINEPGGGDEPVIVTSQYNFLDILYTDGNGNLSVSSEVLASSEGKTPIALCVAKTGFFGENEKARWIALRWGRIGYPDVGSSGGMTTYFGPSGNVQEIDDVSTTYAGASGSGSDWGRFSWGSINNKPPVVPNVYDENGDWNIEVLGTIGDYALTDIDGKAKTAIYLTNVTEENWQTNDTIEDSRATGHWPAVEVTWRVSPNGSQKGDWYIGAAGEYALMENLRDDVETKLTQINNVYSGCISSINNEIWTSTERDNGQNYRMNVDQGQFGSKSKTEKKCVLPMLQY